MAILSDYTVGTIAIPNGSTTVTGVNTAWNVSELQEGDLILVNNRSAVIQSVNSATSITITRPWADTAVPAGTPYRARYMADAARYTAIAKALLTMLASGNVEALAGLTGAADKLPYFNGAATMALADFTALGRSIVNKTDTLSLLAFDGPFGPVLGGSAPAPSEANVGLSDGDLNTITVPGVYTIAGTWSNGVNTAAPAGLTGILMVVARRFGNLYYQFYFQSDIVWVRSSTSPTTSWTPWTRLTQETNAGEFSTNKTIANNSPVFTVRDTDTGAEGRINGASTVGSLFIEADRTDLFPSAVMDLMLSGSSKLRLTKGAGATLAYSGDGQQVLTFATERSWSIRQRGVGSGAQLSFENIQNKAVEFSSETTYTGPQISLLPFGGTGTQILCGGVSTAGHVTPSYAFQGVPGTGIYGYNTTTVGFAAAGARIGYINSGGFSLGERTSSSTAQSGTGFMAFTSGAWYSFASGATGTTVFQAYADALNTPTAAGRLISSTSTGLSATTGSDYRFKEVLGEMVQVSVSAEDFAEMSPAILKLMSLRPLFYKWLPDGEDAKIRAGFLAHELQAIYPHAVFGEKDGMTELGTAVIKGRVIPEYTVKDPVEKTITVPVEIEIDGEMKTVMLDQVITEYVERVVPEYVEPDEIHENVERAWYPDAEWTKTGETPDMQTVDHSLIVPDVVAALQETTMLLLDARREIASLKERVTALEAQGTSA